MKTNRRLGLVAAILVLMLGLAMLLSATAFWTWSYDAFASLVLVMLLPAYGVTSFAVTPRATRR